MFADWSRAQDVVEYFFALQGKGDGVFISKPNIDFLEISDYGNYEVWDLNG